MHNLDSRTKRKEGEKGIMSKDKAIYYNQIDIGILLCILELYLNKKLQIRKRKWIMVHLVYCYDKSKELSKILDGCKW